MLYMKGLEKLTLYSRSCAKRTASFTERVCANGYFRLAPERLGSRRRTTAPS